MEDMRYIIGIDEVGRGALAGPVLVAAVRIPIKFSVRNRGLGKLRDSKKLTAKKRGEWFVYLTSHPKVEYAVSRVYPRRIERINISNAANVAATRAFLRLKSRSNRVLLDGGLYIVKKRMIARTIIRGDEKINAIKMASIIAKVTRDRFMVKLGKLFPKYGFGIHKGYGTEKHMKAIKKYGPCEAHRTTFI